VQGYCEEIGELYGVCPELLMSIIEHESSGNKYAENGSCKGLMQVSVRWHADRMEKLGVTDIYDEYGNILVATDYISELREDYEEVSYVLDVYNGNSKATYNYENGILSVYAKSVLERSAELERLRGK
jgi:soluble lytic murein transglycosylase-like protein